MAADKPDPRPLDLKTLVMWCALSAVGGGTASAVPFAIGNVTEQRVTVIEADIAALQRQANGHLRNPNYHAHLVTRIGGAERRVEKLDESLEKQERWLLRICERLKARCE